MAETATPICLNCVSEPDRLSLKAGQEADRFDIIDNRSGQSLGQVRVANDTRHELELFHGKGGFMAMISSPAGAKYFALPGSSIEVQGVHVDLPGEAITTNASKAVMSGAAKTPVMQTHSRQATILGAGLATRFERISGESTNCSKPGVPLVGDRTVIECLANVLAVHGFTKLIVNTYFKPDSIKASLARSAAQDVLYIDESEPSGTAGGLRKMLCDARYQNLLDKNEPLLVVQGDAVTDADFSELMEAHAANRALVTIGCQLVDEADVDKFGIIVTDKSGNDGQSGRITGFQEKPSRETAKSRLGNTGFYIFSPASYPIVRDIYQDLLTEAQAAALRDGKPTPSEVPIDFAHDIFPAILKRSQSHPDLGIFLAQSVGGYWSDIGNPQQYLESVHDIYAGKVNLPMPHNPEIYYRDGILFWDGAEKLAREEGARLQGNVVVACPYVSSSPTP